MVAVEYRLLAPSGETTAVVAAAADVEDGWRPLKV